VSRSLVNSSEALLSGAQGAGRLRGAVTQARDWLDREISGASAIRPVPAGAVTLRAILEDALAGHREVAG
jgi:hypothetical protein